MIATVFQPEGQACLKIVLFLSLFCQERNNQDKNKVKGTISFGLLGKKYFY